MIELFYLNGIDHNLTIDIWLTLVGKKIICHSMTNHICQNPGPYNTIRQSMYFGLHRQPITSQIINNIN